MNKKQLLAMGLSEMQAEQVMQANDLTASLPQFSRKFIAIRR